MFVCPNCNNTSNEAMNFCTKCGNQMILVETSPVLQGQNQAPLPSKAKIITGMVLSINGIAYAAIGILYVFLLALSSMATYQEDIAIATFICSFIFSLFSLPVSIVGFILSKNTINAGSTSTMSRVGKALGLAGIIVSAVMIVIGFLCFTGSVSTI